MAKRVFYTFGWEIKLSYKKNQDIKGQVKKMRISKFLGLLPALMLAFTGCGGSSSNMAFQKQAGLEKIEKPSIVNEDKLYVASNTAIVGCSNKDKQNFYGAYAFEKVSYLSGLSSSTVDYVDEKMAGTEYAIKADLFKIESADNTVEISSPNYVREEIPNDFSILSDVRGFIGNEAECQYTICKKDGSKTHLRLYVSSDSLWIASYADNTADGSEIIMYIYKLSR